MVADIHRRAENGTPEPGEYLVVFYRLGRVALGLALISTAATAVTFTVVPNAFLPDEHDANPGDGIARSENGNVTFRAAIEEANALPGKDSNDVVGNILGGLVHYVPNAGGYYDE